MRDELDDEDDEPIPMEFKAFCLLTTIAVLLVLKLFGW